MYSAKADTDIETPLATVKIGKRLCSNSFRSQDDDIVLFIIIESYVKRSQQLF